MKLSTPAVGLALAAALLLGPSVLASNKGNLHLFDNATLNGKSLPPGEYKVEWQGTGKNVQVKILRGHDVVATASAMMESGSPRDGDGYTTEKGNSGTEALKGVFFSGKKWTLEIEPSNSVSSPANPTM